MALASSYLDRPVPSDLVAIGEVGLTGELRSVNQLAQRVSEVQRLGFQKCVIPAHRAGALGDFPGLRLIPARNIGEAIRAALRPPGMKWMQAPPSAGIPAAAALSSVQTPLDW